MMEKELRHFKLLEGENLKEVIKIFEQGILEFGRTPAEEVPNLDPGHIVEVNWACIFNKVEDIGKKGLVLITDGQFCLIEIEGGPNDPPLGFYRCEDLTPIEKWKKKV